MVVFLDIVKAFDYIAREAIWRELEKKWGEKIFRMVKACMKKVRVV